MLNREKLSIIIKNISNLMTQNRDYLIELDQQNGDGDLGITMSKGFSEITDFIEQSKEEDLGILFKEISSAFNEAAPSSLGTILAFGFMGMAKSLKGKTEADLKEIAAALNNGVNIIMDKGGAKPGEKTILDSLIPGIEVLSKNENNNEDLKILTKKAFEAASLGSEKTKEMKSVHGRAAYYGDKSIGVLDGGSVVGKLIFEGIFNTFNS